MAMFFIQSPLNIFDLSRVDLKQKFEVILQ